MIPLVVGALEEGEPARIAAGRSGLRPGRAARHLVPEDRRHDYPALVHVGGDHGRGRRALVGLVLSRPSQRAGPHGRRRDVGLSSAAPPVCPAAPVILYWMALRTGAGFVRANLIIFFALTQVFSGAGLLVAGLVTRQSVTLGVLYAPVYLVGLLVGARLFGFSSDATYKPHRADDRHGRGDPDAAGARRAALIGALRPRRISAVFRSAAPASARSPSARSPATPRPNTSRRGRPCSVPPPTP